MSYSQELANECISISPSRRGAGTASFIEPLEMNRGRINVCLAPRLTVQRGFHTPFGQVISEAEHHTPVPCQAPVPRFRHAWLRFSPSSFYRSAKGMLPLQHSTLDDQSSPPTHPSPDARSPRMASQLERKREVKLQAPPQVNLSLS